MKQTAVEWLVKNIPNIFWEDDYWADLFEQAKEMEKQQIIDARDNGFFSSENWKGDSEQYYNKKFKKK